LPAGRVVREAGFEFGQISRVILHRPPYYILGSPESNGYPIQAKINQNQAKITLALRRDVA
ncbi:MAG: hypothetical protein ABSH24_33835, partial [Bryobacteraceae bacterium]